MYTQVFCSQEAILIMKHDSNMSNSIQLGAKQGYKEKINPKYVDPTETNTSLLV